LFRAESGENDLVVTFLTRERGLISALAKNARKSVRRFGGGLLSPGTAAWYDFRIREKRDLAFVERGEANPKAPQLPPDPLIRALSAWALELARAFEAPRNPAPLSFNLLLRHLGALSRAKDDAPPRLLARSLSLSFTKLYMELAGFGAGLEECSRCGRPPEDPGLYLITLNDPRVVCPRCQKKLPEGVGGGAARFPLPLVEKLGKIKDLKNPVLFSLEELEAAENFYRALAAANSGRRFKSPRAIKGLLEADSPPDPPEGGKVGEAGNKEGNP
jgi:DNA repair protein RecO (recombination protein O)